VSHYISQVVRLDIRLLERFWGWFVTKVNAKSSNRSSQDRTCASIEVTKSFLLDKTVEA